LLLTPNPSIMPEVERVERWERASEREGRKVVGEGGGGGGGGGGVLQKEPP